MMGAIVHYKDEFLIRDRTKTRREVDGGEFKGFWIKVAMLFNDKNFAPKIESDQSGHKVDMSDEPTGHKTDATTMETTRFNDMRFLFDRTLKPFMASGAGEGGPIPLDEALGKHASTYFNFCNGDHSLYYFYLVLVKYDLLKSAASHMPEAAAHDSDAAGSSTSTPRSRTPALELPPAKTETNEVIVIQQTEDQKATAKAKRTWAEHQAELAEDNAKIAKIENNERLLAAYTTASSNFQNYAGNDKFLKGAYKKSLKQAKKSLEEALADESEDSDDGSLFNFD